MVDVVGKLAQQAGRRPMVADRMPVYARRGNQNERTGDDRRERKRIERVAGFGFKVEDHGRDSAKRYTLTRVGLLATALAE